MTHLCTDIFFDIHEGNVCIIANAWVATHVLHAYILFDGLERSSTSTHDDATMMRLSKRKWAMVNSVQNFVCGRYCRVLEHIPGRWCCNGVSFCGAVAV